MIARLVARARSLWRGARAGERLDAEMEEEFRLHQELRAADLERAGLTPHEARRRARLEFGSAERFKHEGRGARGLRTVDTLGISWLDLKLGGRMLVRYPGLTIVGGLAMAFAIWVGAGAFEFVRQVVSPAIPLPAGDRLVGIQLWDAEAARPHRRVAHELAEWRGELRAVQDLGAFRTVQRNLIVGEGGGVPVTIAEVSAAAFRVARVAPLLGRALVEADERAGAPAVVVLGHRTWRARFDGDSAVVGRPVRIGRTHATVVGVMPEGFAFPVSHVAWTPLQLELHAFPRGAGPTLQLFGRLAPGATLDEAQAELTALGRRAAADHPETHANLRPQVLPYARSILNLSGTQALLVGSTNLFLVALLVLVCANVALLLFARAATREAELVVRTALGAGRARIVGQLFAEALVLGGLAAAVGLVGAGAGMRWAYRMVEADMLDGGTLPFWFEPGLSPATIVYALLLTLAGAAIAGVVPALKVTRGLQARLRAAGAGGGGLRFGGLWTAVIVSQVAVTVAFPVAAFGTRRDARQIEAMEVNLAESDYLAVRVQLDREPPPGRAADTSAAAFAARLAAAQGALLERLRADPLVAGVTVAERLPRMYHPHRLIELDAGGAVPVDPRWPMGHRVSAAAVAPDFFAVLGAPVLAGRGFHEGDVGSAARPVVVNEAFVARVLGGRNPIGRRLRYTRFEEREVGDDAAAPAEPWYEIVGVVPTMGMSSADDPKASGICHPLAPGAAHPAHLAVHVRGDPMAAVPAVRAAAAAVDPTLRLDGFAPIARLSDDSLRFLAFWFRLTLAVSAGAVMLSLAGIYAVMSFTVSRRTREIGLRIALGAPRRRVVLAVLARPLRQVALGVVVGGALIALLPLAAGGDLLSPRAAALLALYVATMLGVCLLACVVPTRRALRVEPTEALRVDG